MKNRNLDHKDHWATPKDLYDKLNKEFNFDFDPCPLHSEFDGLNLHMIKEDADWWVDRIGGVMGGGATIIKNERPPLGRFVIAWSQDG